MEMSVQRPWQGTVMGVLNAIGVVFGFMAVIALIFGGTFIAAALEDAGLAMLAGFSTTIIAVVLIPFLILYIFITLGFFKGQKWAVIVALVLTAIGTIGNVVSLSIIPLLINAFFIYCYIICMKDAYYK
ncbi:hypothetical protein [Carboxylicivirga taeanensis]|uniref:hypothetical protein n=1 Tax=Carboxylicivirga taeanensis TaxID=1416875 RepID=UPI003F6DB47E